MPTGAGPRRIGLLAALSGAAFALVASLYRAGMTRELDRQIELTLRDVHSESLDLLSGWYDVVFRPTPTFAVAAVFVIVLWRFGPRWSWCAPIAIVLVALAEVIAKNGWSQVLHVRALIDGVMVLFGGHYHAPASFPSGHVARAVFLGVIALACLPRWLSLPVSLLAATTPLARMYTEQHRLSDVLGGALLGICIGAAALWAVGLLTTIEGDRGWRWRAFGGRRDSKVRARADPAD